MKIRDFAKQNGHEVVGKLVRVAERERGGCRFYVDGGGNEYWVGKYGICIVTVDGGVI